MLESPRVLQDIQPPLLLVLYKALQICYYDINLPLSKVGLFFEKVNIFIILNNIYKKRFNRGVKYDRKNNKSFKRSFATYKEV